MKANKIMTVSELSALVKKTMDEKTELANVWIRGEISNFKKHAAGHLYFSLKDDRSSIRAVMFKSRSVSLNFFPQDGMDCLVKGYVSVFERDVAVQLYAEEIVPAGTGLQHLALEALKKKLQAKGYFATERKRPLPAIPRGLGVVTSPTGAAIRDIQNVVYRRYPGMPIYLYPALVQGDRAAAAVAAGIVALGSLPEADVVIIARGGGSREDLAVFNDESVAAAVYACPKPVISAVGHEIDYSIADLVADVRAATPTAAGELAVPVKAELLKTLDKYGEKLYRALNSRLERDRMRLGYLLEAGVMKNPERWLRLYQEKLSKQETLVFDLFETILKKKQSDTQVIAGKLSALSPLDTLARGYAICKKQDGRIVVQAGQVELNERLDIQLNRGFLECTVTKKGED
ncbi:MAG: exodeoxyribonuclease VII large subunit [Clostridia bacterium]|jgi:exodeoxyribonuclease VII large subunit|nr:exodeoxyribonuclease VII large subunit [Clostridia bacterium]